MDLEARRQAYLQAEQDYQEALKRYNDAVKNDPEKKSWFTAAKARELKSAKSWLDKKEYELKHF